MKNIGRISLWISAAALALSALTGCSGVSGSTGSSDPAGFTGSSDLSAAVASVDGAGSSEAADPADSASPAEALSSAEPVSQVKPAESDAAPDYSDMKNWAYFEDGENKTADVFFICPTVYLGANNSFNMSLSDEKTKSDFLGAINMEKGIYDGDARFFAPYYRQAGLNAYADDYEKYLSFAFRDIKAAFDYYMENENNGRPLILAGFSQGGDHSIRLMKEYFGDEKYSKLLVACYAIGWGIAAEEAAEFPQLKIAQGEDDIGVVILFNSEAENVDDSIMIPRGMKTFTVNPLNWKSDGTPADKSLNLGACFTDYSGNIVKEIPQLTGAYIDSERGALKVTDVTAEDYPPVLDVFAPGVFHLYDYQFFYRNLQKNVAVRVESYCEQVLNEAA